MRKIVVAALLAFTSVIAVAGSPVQASTITLANRAYQLDGSFTGSIGALPGGAPYTSIDESLFNLTTGLGTIRVSISGAGFHTFDVFVDHQIDTTSNEFGTVNGVPAAGQSYELDDPILGNIFSHVATSLLDNSNSVGSGQNDVSMALGWDFVLGVGEIASINLDISDVRPLSGFFLSQTDPGAGSSIYFADSLRIGTGTTTVPEPSTIALCCIGLAALMWRRRNV